MPPERPIIHSFSDARLSFSDDFVSWSETIKSGDGGFGRKGGGGAWVRMSTGAGEEDFSLSAKQQDGIGADDGSGTLSPTLWAGEKANGAGGHDRQLFDEMPQSGELNPRSQIMAKHRREMMELVRDMPESSYELSLRDIVELRVDEGRVGDQDKGKMAAPAAKEMKKRETRNRATRRPAAVKRSESLDTGMLLKMFLPGRRTAVARSSSAAASGPRKKVLPRQRKVPVATAEVEKVPDLEWWKSNGGRRSTGSCSSSRSGSRSSHGGGSVNSTNSGGSGGFGLSRAGSVVLSGDGSNNNLLVMSRRSSACFPFLKSCSTTRSGAFEL